MAKKEPVPGEFKLLPSDFSFLWRDCKRCFWLKVKKGHQRPRGIMPGIFNVIDSAMKTQFKGMQTKTLSEILGVEFPEGMIVPGGNVRSGPIVVDGKRTGMYITGKTDSMFKLTNGHIGIPDFKTSNLTAKKVEPYHNAMRAYAFCRENPEDWKVRSVVDIIGLIGYNPTRFAHAKDKGPEYGFLGDISWWPIEWGDQGRLDFNQFLFEMAEVLHSDEPPAIGNSTYDGKPCEYCTYRETVRGMEE